MFRLAFDLTALQRMYAIELLNEVLEYYRDFYDHSLIMHSKYYSLPIYIQEVIEAESVFPETHRIYTLKELLHQLQEEDHISAAAA
jgi:hypothetical protein